MMQSGFWDKTNLEDWRVCELSQLGISSSAYTPGPYSARESISAAFDREYLRVMECGGLKQWATETGEQEEQQCPN